MKRHKYYFKKQLKPFVRKFYYVKIIKFLTNNLRSPVFLRQTCMNKLIVRNKIVNFNKFRQFCLFSGRTRFILKSTKMSRMFFKKNVSLGFATGTFKLS